MALFTLKEIIESPAKSWRPVDPAASTGDSRLSRAPPSPAHQGAPPQPSPLSSLWPLSRQPIMLMALFSQPALAPSCARPGPSLRNPTRLAPDKAKPDNARRSGGCSRHLSITATPVETAQLEGANFYGGNRHFHLGLAPPLWGPTCKWGSNELKVFSL